MSFWTRPKLVWVPFLIPSWAIAQVIGPYILVKNQLLDYPKEAVLRVLMHELAHVRQWNKYRVTFPFRYAWGWVQAGFSYHQNRFEREAEHMADIESHKWLANALYHEHFEIRQEFLNDG